MKNKLHRVYDDIDSLGGGNNQSGADVEVYFVPYAKVAEFAEYMEATALGDGVTIEDSHTFGGDDGFFKIASAQKVNQANGKSMGPADGTATEQTFKFRIPGNGAKTADLANQMQNDQFVFMSHDPNDAGGTFNQYGIKGQPATVNWEFDSAKPGEGEKGYIFTVTATHRMTKYTGTLTLHD